MVAKVGKMKNTGGAVYAVMIVMQHKPKLGFGCISDKYWFRGPATGSVGRLITRAVIGPSAASCHGHGSFFSAASPFLSLLCIYQIQSDRCIFTFHNPFSHSNSYRPQCPRRKNSKMVRSRSRSLPFAFLESSGAKTVLCPATTGLSARTITTLATFIDLAASCSLMAMASFYNAYNLRERLFELSGACQKMSHLQA